ncbi:DUF975 family protein [Bacillus salinus]|uniref:DUF975 family protein n=1 Tax=Bacillus sp. HMF5848 TaxID=2495421 RepID=UPI001C8BC7E9
MRRLSNNPKMGYKEALELSKKMTHGEKFNIFVLNLSFFGWFILGVLTFVYRFIVFSSLL